MYIGIDLGTSGVKAILLNEQGEVLASHTAPLTVSRPHPLWSEQDPEHWWQATDRAMKALAAAGAARCKSGGDRRADARRNVAG